MSNQNRSLPSQVVDAIRGGNTIEAIKRLRQATGLDLKQAKEMVEAHAKRLPATRKASTPAAPAAPAGFPEAVAEAIQRGSVIEAIKLLRDQKDLGLKEAKDAVERARQSSLRGPDGPPDTFNRVVDATWWILAVALAGIVAYYLLSGG